MVPPPAEAALSLVGDAQEGPTQTSDRERRKGLILLEGGAGAGEVVSAAAQLLIATLSESGAWYTKAATDLNKGRDNEQKVLIVPEDELADRAVAWLNDERLKVTQVRPAGTYRCLYSTADRPLMVLPLPSMSVDHPITHRETLQTWANSRDGRINNWWGSLAFIEQWPADQISGDDYRQPREHVRFVVIETAYDWDRRGSRENQLHQLRRVQVNHPSIGSASMFEVGVLAHRYSEVPNSAWEDTNMRAIELKPNHDGCVPGVAVRVNGHAEVVQSGFGFADVSRRRIA